MWGCILAVSLAGAGLHVLLFCHLDLSGTIINMLCLYIINVWTAKFKNIIPLFKKKYQNSKMLMEEIKDYPNK